MESEIIFILRGKLNMAFNNKMIDYYEWYDDFNEYLNNLKISLTSLTYVDIDDDENVDNIVKRINKFLDCLEEFVKISDYPRE